MELFFSQAVTPINLYKFNVKIHANPINLLLTINPNSYIFVISNTEELIAFEVGE